MTDAAKSNRALENTCTYPSTKDIDVKLLKKEKYEQLVYHEDDDMATVRRLLIYAWLSHTPELRDKYNDNAKPKKDKCAICLQENIERSQEDILWVLCDGCDKWYHIDCVYIDAVHSTEVPRYSCLECFKKCLGGLSSFINHYRYA